MPSPEIISPACVDKIGKAILEFINIDYDMIIQPSFWKHYLNNS
jgi:hypothetical protein